jgi:hypoxanthine phosphoribosyltransferase
MLEWQFFSTVILFSARWYRWILTARGRLQIMAGKRVHDATGWGAAATYADPCERAAASERDQESEGRCPVEERAVRMWREAIQQVLISEAELQRRVQALGRVITADYRGQDLVFISVLKGAMVFIADLARAVDLPLTIDFMALSSYGDSDVSSGTVRIVKDLDETITGKHVLIVEDIIDTGVTLRYLWQHLMARQPADLSICVLLDKRARRQVDLPIKYRGFDVPDRFVVGYGLDYRGRYRNLPFIGTLRP